MGILDGICNDASRYPLNFAGGNTPEYVLQSYRNQLQEHQSRLFSNDAGTALNFWEFANQGNGRNPHDTTTVLKVNRLIKMQHFGIDASKVMVVYDPILG
jgi:hypothetical protein